MARLQAAASSYCWLTPAHPDPLGEQLVSLAEAIEKAERTKGLSQRLPIRGGDFHRFRLSLSKRSRSVGPLLRRADLQAARGADGGGGGGGGRVRGEPHGRGAGGVWRRAVVDADLVRAPAAHGLPHAHAAGGL